MAIDKKQVKAMLNAVDGLFEQIMGMLPKQISAETVRFLKEKVMGAAVDELRDLVVNARPPRLYLMGRSGHGKSSLINALANRDVVPVGAAEPTSSKSDSQQVQAAAVGAVSPTTPEATLHTIQFPEVNAAWDVVDSRGIFESTRPDGASNKNAVEQVKDDMPKYKPDVILHVVATRECRAMSEDFRVAKEIRDLVKGRLGAVPPTVMVLTLADLVDPPRDSWPPAAGGAKLANIRATLDYVARNMLGVHAFEPLDPARPAQGCRITEESFVRGIVPVGTPRNETSWNIELLSTCIGEVIPKAAQLDFFQAQQRRTLLKRVALDAVHRFAAIAGVAGATPLPFADMLVLTPLQILMIAFVGGLSCRSFSIKTALEFLAAGGVMAAAGWGLREVAHQMVKFIPFLTAPLSGGIAYSGTLAMGQSAVSYFFLGEQPKPQEFVSGTP